MSKEHVMRESLRVLIVEDSEDDARLVLRELRHSGYEPVFERVDSEAAMRKALADKHWDLILSDYMIPGFGGMEALRIAKESGLDLPFILVSNKVSEETLVEAMRAGAMDFVMKDRLSRLGPVVKRELADAAARREVIAEHKRAEDALRDSEQKYRTLADSSPALIWASGTDKLCNYFNQPWLRFTGRTLEQEMGNGWAEGMHPDDFVQCLATYTGAFDRREPFSMEYRLRRHDGEFRWVRDDGCPRYDSKGEFIGYLGYVMDITDRRRAEDALLKSERDLKEAQRLAQIGSWDWDAATDTITWSDEYYRIYGFDPAQRPPGYVDHLKAYTPESAARLDAAVKRSMQTGEPYELDLELVGTEKTSRWVTARSETKRDAQGRIVGLRGTAQDITVRKHAEQSIAAQLDELRRWHALNLDREERLMELKHEVNELLGRLNESVRYPSAE